ncbi:TerB family tellurite resistance protein [Candidatus Pelagibacter sp.]|nr:TerB family tellurite resistance protein [Candidatus Pelagibacter sp.]
MFDVFKNNKKNVIKDNNLYINVGALLIHVAKIDENYSKKEKEIIRKTLLELGLTKDALDSVFKKSEQTEKNSNQILAFTKEVKNKDEEFKIKIVEALWKIIYADNVSDMYEMSLMRRLTGLLYLDPKIVGDIKNKLINPSDK